MSAELQPGFRVVPRSALVPRLRRLRRAEVRDEGARRRRRRPREDGVRIGHRVLLAVPVLPGDLRLPHDSRPSAGNRDGAQARESRARRLGRDRGRRRSIGGNHLLHALRRNVGFKILLFNNEIYGLTVVLADVTPRYALALEPGGLVRFARLAGAFALGAGAKFIARAIDVDKAGLGSVLEAAHGFDGTAFVEIFQNCIVYNDGVFNSFIERRQGRRCAAACQSMGYWCSAKAARKACIRRQDTHAEGRRRRPMRERRARPR